MKEPKEKAEELIKKFMPDTLTDFSDENFESTRNCAIICVDEIIKSHGKNLCMNDFDYYEEVKNHLNQMR